MGHVGNLALRGMPLQPGCDGGEDEGYEEPGAGGGVGASGVACPAQGGGDGEHEGQDREDVRGAHERRSGLRFAEPALLAPRRRAGRKKPRARPKQAQVFGGCPALPLAASRAHLHGVVP